MPDHDFGAMGVHLVYPHRRHLPLRVRALAADSPSGKLPCAVWPDGTRVADSSAHLLEAPFDSAAADKALGHARFAQHLEWVRRLMD